MTEREMNQLVCTLEALQRDLACCQKRVETLYARYARKAHDAHDVPNAREARVVNKQNSNTHTVSSVNNKQKQTCVCVSVTGDKATDDSEHTHTDFLSLDFLQSHLPSGIPAWYAAYWHKQMTSRGWKLKDGHAITAANWEYFLGVFYSHATETELAAAKAQSENRASPEVLAWLYAK